MILQIRLKVFQKVFKFQYDFAGIFKKGNFENQILDKFLEVLNSYLPDKEIKLFNHQEAESIRFEKASMENTIAFLKFESTNIIASPLVQILLALALATITWVALDSSVLEVMTAGTFIGFFGAAGLLAKPIRNLTLINALIQRGIVASETIFDQMDELPEEDNGKIVLTQCKGNLQFKSVSFSYENSTSKALDSLSCLLYTSPSPRDS